VHVVPSQLAKKTLIREIMTPAVLCVTRDLGVVALTRLLLERGISGAPVVDERGHPIGVVSKTDLVGRLEEDTIVADVMMPVAFTLRAVDTLERAAQLMAAEHVHRIPIIDDDGRVCGILTTFDVARWVAQK
jgi:CBS domain-containing protein